MQKNLKILANNKNFVFQNSGIDKETKAIVEVPGPHVQHISGLRLLDNHSVNLISSILTAFITPCLAMYYY